MVSLDDFKTSNVGIVTTGDGKNGKEEMSFTYDKNQSMDIKESKFKELIGQLQKWGYKVTDRSKENKIEGIQFKAEVFPLLPYASGVRTPFFLEFQNDLEDGFIIRSTFELDKNIEIHLKNQKRSREIELTYIEIEQIVLPLKVYLMRAHPFIYLYKIVFLQDLTKQFLYDSINALINAMSLIIGKWDEKYYQLKPKDDGGQLAKKI